MKPQHPFWLVLMGLTLIAPLAFADEDTTATAGTAPRVLHLLTWSDYLDEDLVKRFEETHNAKLVFTYFETDAHRIQLLAQQGPRGFDLSMVDTVSIPPLVTQGWVQPLDPDKAPNLRHLDPRCLAGIQKEHRIGAPYAWGTLGIAYRGDLLAAPIESWMQLYRPADELKGKIVMLDDPWEVLTMASKALGNSLATESAEQWNAAGALAMEQRPYVHTYGAVSLDEHSALVSGEVLAAQVYNGEALSLQEHNPHILYTHPKEGSSYWVDHWVLFREAPEPELAHAFLNFLNAPENAAANAQSIYFATCNKAAEALLPSQFREDPIIYPPAEVMGRLEPYRMLSPRSIRRINSIYSQIKDGS